MPINSDNNPKINYSKAKKIIDKAGINENLKEVEELHRGWNTLYKLETEREKYCLRIFTNDFGGCGIEWKADKEDYFHKKLVQNGVKSPEAIFKDSSKSIIDYPYIILEFVGGIPLQGISNPLTDAKEYLDILEEIGEQMALIHQTEMPKLSKYDFPLNQGYETLRESIEDRIEYCPDKQVREKIIEHLDELEKTLPEEDKVEKVPVHTEITDRNVLVKKEDKWRLSSIIDVEWGVKSLPEREFVRPTFELLYYQNDREQFRKRLKHLLKGYYRKGGKLKYPEVIPILGIQHLLWGSREDPNRNLPKIRNNLNEGEEIVEEYRSIIEEIEE